MIGRHRLLGPVPICQCCAQPFHFTIIRSYFVWSASFESQPVPKQSICWSRRHSCPAITSVIFYQRLKLQMNINHIKVKTVARWLWCRNITRIHQISKALNNLFLWFLWSWPEAVDSFVELAREVEEDAKPSLVKIQTKKSPAWWNNVWEMRPAIALILNLSSYICCSMVLYPYNADPRKVCFANFFKFN